jgi:hypothetical protein
VSQGTCRRPGCGAPAFRGGLCKPHHERWRNEWVAQYGEVDPRDREHRHAAQQLTDLVLEACEDRALRGDAEEPCPLQVMALYQHIGTWAWAGEGWPTLAALHEATFAAQELLVRPEHQPTFS